MNPNYSCTVIFFANAPDLNELCALTLHVPDPADPAGKDENSHALPSSCSSATPSQMHSQYSEYGESQIFNTQAKRKSYSQPQIIRCRELIFTELDVIASPGLNHEKTLQVIMKCTDFDGDVIISYIIISIQIRIGRQQGLFKSGRLQARFFKMGLKAEKPVRVSPALFNSCLRYTVEARLAPSWNRVGQYLVQGREFLTSKQRLNAVKMELTANEREFYLSVEAKVIKLTPIQLEDLEIPPPVVERFSTHPDDVIQEYSIENNWCYILPSMKRGKVINVSHRLPRNCPFRSYRDIKRHWKNSYGYRLPEDESNVNYYQIYFKLIGETLFTYPECCVRSRDLHVLPRTDPKPILQAFLTDIQSKISNICGQKFHFQTKASFLVSSLNKICEEGKGNSNLTSKTPVPAPGFQRGPSSVPVFQNDSSNMEVQQVCSSSAAPASNPLTVVGKSGIHPSHTNSFTPNMSKAYTEGSQQKDIRKDFKKSQFHDGHISQNSRQENSGQLYQEVHKPDSRPRIFPIFNRMKPAASSVRKFQSVERIDPKVVPIFRPKIPAVAATNLQPNQKIQPFSQKQKQPLEADEAKLTSFSQRNQAFNPMETNSTSRNNESFEASSFPMKPNFGHVNGNSGAKDPTFGLQGYGAKRTRDGSNVMKPGHALTTSTLGSKLKLKKRISNGCSRKPPVPVVLPHVDFSMGPPPGLQFPPVDISEQNSQSSQSSLQSMSTYTSSTPIKRVKPPGQKDHDEATKPKKQRTKQMVQEGTDVTLLAHNDQLYKANAATLTAWLKVKGILCKAKDKKTDLVEKVKLALNIVSTEQ